MVWLWIAKRKQTFIIDTLLPPTASNWQYLKLLFRGFLDLKLAHPLNILDVCNSCSVCLFTGCKL